MLVLRGVRGGFFLETSFEMFFCHPPSPLKHPVIGGCAPKTIISLSRYHRDNLHSNTYHSMQKKHMGVSENSGTPKSSILIGISIKNHPFWVPLFLETPIYQ